MFKTLLLTTLSLPLKVSQTPGPYSSLSSASLCSLPYGILVCALSSDKLMLALLYKLSLGIPGVLCHLNLHS